MSLDGSKQVWVRRDEPKKFAYNVCMACEQLGKYKLIIPKPFRRILYYTLHLAL